jgi:hypothetical protein
MEFIPAKPANILVPAALFAALAPGMLLTVGGPVELVSVMPGTANLQVVLVHTLAFAVAYGALRYFFPEFY